MKVREPPKRSETYEYLVRYEARCDAAVRGVGVRDCLEAASATNDALGGEVAVVVVVVCSGSHRPERDGLELHVGEERTEQRMTCI